MHPEDEQNQRVVGKARQFQIGAAIVCEQHRSVTIGGERQVATDLSWRFLMALVDAAPDVVSYETLRNLVWEHSAVTDETMAQRASQVRQLLGDDPKDPSYVRTIRGKGYQLITPVEDFVSSTSDRSRWATRALFVVAIAIAGFWWINRETPRDPAEFPDTTPHTSELVARANEYLGRGQQAANELAVELYNEALRLEPDNEAALVGLSFALSHRPSKYEASNKWAEDAAELADRALLLNSENADAWAARGLADDARGRVRLAMRYYQRAYELDSNSNRLASIAFLLQIQGKLHEALLMEAQALGNGPPTFFSDYQIATALQLAGLESAASAWLRRAERLRPDNVFLVEYKARQLIVSQSYSDTLRLLESAGDERFGNVALRGVALLASNEPDKATDAFAESQAMAVRVGSDCYECIAALSSADDSEYREYAQTLLSQSDELIDDGEEWPSYRIKLAYLQVALGDHTGALASLNEAFDLGYLDWRWLQATPFLTPLRSSAGFQQLVVQMKNHVDSERELIVADDRLARLLEEFHGSER